MTPGSCPSDTSAHPRSRGENARYVSPQASSDGSSPLTRGKPSRRKTPTLNTGLIPAHAGKTVASWRIRQAARAHPRSRGENYRPGHCEHRCDGSSPLTRGKRFGVEVAAVGGGLIPAHAGKTKAAQQMVVNFQAHPRSRGENRAQNAPVRPGVGSSPLTRGKRQKWSVVRIARRLIPAHAGKTARHVCVLLHGGAHPRSRGENEMITGTRGASAGSSPLTRGKLLECGRNPAGAGLIPAHAGKTQKTHGWAILTPAHPRSRGENHLRACE